MGLAGCGCEKIIPRTPTTTTTPAAAQTPRTRDHSPTKGKRQGERGGKDRALAKARQEEPRHIHTGPLPWRDTAAGSAKKPFLGYYVLQAHEVDPNRGKEFALKAAKLRVTPVR